MKLRSWALALAGLLVFGVSAGSALAQRDAAKPAPRLQHYDPDQQEAAPAPAAANSQLKPRSNASGDFTDTCTYTFTTGAGRTYLQFCVTVNGNITEFQSPVGVEQLSPDSSAAYEGYGICDVTTDAQYWDYAEDGDSGNWNAPVKVSSNATSVKIARTTADGAWTLTQTISIVTGTTPYAKIIMALKNNSGVTKEAELIRFANAVPYTGTPYEEDYNGTYDSAWGNAENRYGMMVQFMGVTPTSLSYDYANFPIEGINGPAPCDALSDGVYSISDATGSLIDYTALNSLKKDQTATITARYLPL